MDEQERQFDWDIYSSEIWFKVKLNWQRKKLCIEIRWIDDSHRWLKHMESFIGNGCDNFSSTMNWKLK